MSIYGTRVLFHLWKVWTPAMSDGRDNAESLAQQGIGVYRPAYYIGRRS
jgi:hypothetical protein